MAMVASQVVITANGMSSGFLYESAKDCLKWAGLSVEEHIRFIMSVGTHYCQSDEDFEKFKNDNEYLEVSVTDLEELFNGNHTHQSRG